MGSSDQRPLALLCGGEWFFFSYRCSPGVFPAVVWPSEPQDILGAVEELGEAVKLAVGEIDGRLRDKEMNESVG